MQHTSAPLPSEARYAVQPKSTHPVIRINAMYVLYCLAAVVFTWLIHEFAHWATGEALGNAMAMTLNTSYPESGRYLAAGHDMIVSAAGPIVTLVQAFVVYGLLKNFFRPLLFPLLLTCLYMRIIAGALNLINLNDEGRISADLGIGTYTLSLLVIAVLFYLTYAIVKRHRISTKAVVATTLLVMLFSSILVLSDQALHLKLL